MPALAGAQPRPFAAERRESDDFVSMGKHHHVYADGRRNTSSAQKGLRRLFGVAHGCFCYMGMERGVRALDHEWLTDQPTGQQRRGCMKREEWVDFFMVRDEHRGVDQRLQAWARWVRVRPHGWQVQPMFRQYRPEAWEARENRRTPTAAVNTLEAVDMEKALSNLPDKHKDALRWVYLWSTVTASEARMNGWPYTVSDIRRHLGATKQDLGELIARGRTMLVNSGVLAKRHDPTNG